jgi:hypothetical protein
MMSSRDGDCAAQARSTPPLVLFASRLNTAASIMAEAMLKHFAQGRLRAARGPALASIQDDWLYVIAR